MKTEKIIKLFDKLIDLLDEHTENFIAERPFLWKGEVFDCENLEERQKSNELKIKKTIRTISEELDNKLSKKIQKTEQTTISDWLTT